MKAEMERKISEQNDLEIKAEASESLCILLQNAICYMQEQGMLFKEIANYIGCSEESIILILKEDYKGFLEEIKIK